MRHLSIVFYALFCIILFNYLFLFSIYYRADDTGVEISVGRRRKPIRFMKKPTGLEMELRKKPIRLYTQVQNMRLLFRRSQ